MAGRREAFEEKIDMLTRVFNEQNKSTVKIASVLAIASLLSSMLGLLRDRILTANFGTGGILDGYFMAFKIPDLLYNFLILGTLSISFIPIFTEYLTKGKKDEAWRIANSVLNTTLIVVGVFSIALVIFAPFFVGLVAPGFSGEKYDSTVKLMRLVALSPIIFSVSSIFTSILNSFKRFFIASLAPIVYNLGIIIGVVFLYPKMGVWGLGVGVLVGALFHLLIQLPAAIKSGYRYQGVIEISSGIKEIWKMYLPKIFLIDISQVSLFVGSIIASTQDKAVSIFNLAYNLNSLPIGLFAVSFVVVVFPKLSEMYAQDNLAGFKKQFCETLTQILFLILPISFMLFALRAQAVRLVYGTGKFTWEDTQLTLATLGFFAISLFSQGLISLINRSFFARHNTKTPMMVGIGITILNVILSINLVKTSLGITGLALAFSISSILNFLILGGILYYKLGGFDGRELARSISKIIIASLVMVVAVQVVKIFIGKNIDLDTFMEVFIQTLASGAVGVLVYLSMGWILKLRQAELLLLAIFKPIIKK